MHSEYRAREKPFVKNWVEYNCGQCVIHTHTDKNGWTVKCIIIQRFSTFYVFSLVLYANRKLFPTVVRPVVRVWRTRHQKTNKKYWKHPTKNKWIAVFSSIRGVCGAWILEINKVSLPTRKIKQALSKMKFVLVLIAIFSTPRRVLPNLFSLHYPQFSRFYVPIDIAPNRIGLMIFAFTCKSIKVHLFISLVLFSSLSGRFLFHSFHWFCLCCKVSVSASACMCMMVTVIEYIQSNSVISTWFEH